MPAPPTPCATCSRCRDRTSRRRSGRSACARPGSTRSDVLGALDRGEVVRSMPMRVRLHFIAPEDLGWMLALTAERTLASAAARRRALDLDEQILRRAADVTARVLAGTSFGRDDYLARLGLVCWGPTSGRQQALVLNEEWIRAPRRLSRTEALRERGIRYFTGHGAATVRDLAWWTKLSLTDARTAVAAAGDDLWSSISTAPATGPLERGGCCGSSRGRTRAARLRRVPSRLPGSLTRLAPGQEGRRHRGRAVRGAAPQQAAEFERAGQARAAFLTR